MENWILAGVLLVIIVSASLYVYKSKKKGSRCVGCPHGKTCSHNNCDDCR